MPCQQVTKEDIDALNRKRAWATALTAGSITATALYWIGQCPVYQQALIKQAIEAVLAIK